MNFDNQVIYTQAQKDFIQRMLKSIPEVRNFWKQNLEEWGEKYDYTFFTELHPFIDLTEEALLSDNKKLAKKILSLVEQFLSSADQESKNAIAYFFFEDLINSLSWQDKKYMQIFINLLGPHSIKCCKLVDKFWDINTKA